MDSPSTWVLLVAFWVHMVATVVWVGGLALQALVVWPAARAALGAGPQLVQVMRQMQKRFLPLAWLSLAALTVTGLMQMSASPSYEGLLQVTNAWAAAMLAKHLAVGAMLLVGLYQQMRLLPELERLALLETHGRAAPEVAARLRRREQSLTRLNLACGLLVLAFTAAARVL